MLYKEIISIYIYMNQFQEFMNEKLIPTDKVLEPLIKSKEVISK